ncbi:MAG: ABC transporter permease [Gammaproteobacteria bacterium]|nr:ABC transporter permease [Gammaproteobacteria bacterium]
MSIQANWVAYKTIVRKEVRRFIRIWPQTILPPAVTTGLYFLIFGALIGRRIGDMGGFSYMEFVAPGLIMMTIITNSYSNVASSFFSAKFQNSVEELLVSPMPNWVILAGWVTGGVARGLCVAAVVTVLTLFFTDIHVQHVGLTVIVILSTAILFATAGFINAVYARTFDDVSIIPTFVLTPLTYLGGIFYSITLLSEFWQSVSHANPIFYMVNAFRFGVLGESDVSPYIALSITAGATLVLILAALKMLNGSRMRS